MKDSFILNCKKRLIFRKEFVGYVAFDPVGLEFYTLNEIAAEIMYLVSEGLNYYQIFEYYSENYDIQEDEFKETLQVFFQSSPFLDLLYPELIKNKVVCNCYL